MAEQAGRAVYLEDPLRGCDSLIHETPIPFVRLSTAFVPEPDNVARL
jgi:hypothetical protein